MLKITANSVVIPTDYAALGAYTGFKPRTADQLRIFAIGLCGEGKSTFVASIPNSIVLDFERGTDLIPSSANMRISIESMEHYEKLKAQLLKDGEANRHPAKRIIIDTADEWVAFYAAAITREKDIEAIEEYGQHGSGWALLRRRIMHDLDSFWMAGYSWLLVGHLQEKTITKPKSQQTVTVLRESLFPSVATAIKRKADYFMSVMRVPITVTTYEEITVNGKTIKRPVQSTQDQYKLLVAGDLEIPGKGRIQLASNEYILPKKGGWGVFEAAYDEAVARELSLLEPKKEGAA